MSFFKRGEKYPISTTPQVFVLLTTLSSYNLHGAVYAEISSSIVFYLDRLLCN